MKINNNNNNNNNNYHDDNNNYNNKKIMIIITTTTTKLNRILVQLPATNYLTKDMYLLCPYLKCFIIIIIINNYWSLQKYAAIYTVYIILQFYILNHKIYYCCRKLD